MVGRRHRRRSRSLLAASGFTILLGVLITAIPFFTAEESAAFWNSVMVGALVFSLAGYTAWAAAEARPGTTLWPAALNVILGVWLVVFAFIARAGAAYTGWTAALGVVLALVAAQNLYAAKAARRRRLGRGRPGL